MKRVFLASLLMPFLFCVSSGMAADRISENNIEKKVDSIFRRLSTREKIAQIMVVDLWSGDSPARKKIQNRLVRKEKIGGIIIMDDALNPAVDRVNQLHRMAEIPLLVTIDGEWGASMRYPELHAFPRQMQLGALTDESLIYEMGYAVGKECRDLNIHVNFAPDVVTEQPIWKGCAMPAYAVRQSISRATATPMRIRTRPCRCFPSPAKGWTLLNSIRSDI